jgi:hypothetical protein
MVHIITLFRFFPTVGGIALK